VKPNGMSSTTSTRARIQFAGASLALVAFHLAWTDYFVPLRAVLSKQPLTGDDYDLHIGQIFRVVEGLSRWGHAWLYDVQLVAGQPEGTITDSGSKAWELWTYAWVSVGVDRAVAFNLFVWFTMLGCPVLMFSAARLLRLDRWSSLAAAAMASTLWFFDSNVHWMWFIGMVSWGLCACWSALTLALFIRFVQRPRAGWAFASALSLGTNLLIHPYCFFTLAPPMAAVYLRALRSSPRRMHAGVAAIALIAIAMNAYWLINAARHWHYILDSAFYAQADPWFLLCDMAQLLCSGADTGVIGTRTGFRFLYLGLALAGLWVLRRRSDPLWLPLAVSLISGYLLAYASGLVPALQQTQPYRHIVPASLLSTLPAAIFVAYLVREHALSSLSRGGQLLLGVVCLLTLQHLVVQVAYFVPRLLPEPRRLLDGSRSFVSRYGFWRPEGPSELHYGVPRDASLEQGLAETIDWITCHVPTHARVLVQGNVLGERLAWQGNVEVLGGFFERNVQHAYANFFRDYHDRPASMDDLARHLRVFAVDWVVGDRPELERANQMLKLVTKVGGRNIYRTRMPVDRVLAGGGTVRASENRIDVDNSDPAQGVIVSYHWHEALRCRPDCQISRVALAPDRVGFIGVRAPHPASFTIWNSYQF
jgi:hypothetical protein